MYKHFCFVEETTLCNPFTFHCPVAEAKVESGHQSLMNVWKGFKYCTNLFSHTLYPHTSAEFSKCWTLFQSSLKFCGIWDSHSKLCLLPASCWFHMWLTLQPWRWGNLFLQNVSWLSVDCTVLYPTRQTSSSFIFEVVCHSVIYKLSKLGLFT